MAQLGNGEVGARGRRWRRGLAGAAVLALGLTGLGVGAGAGTASATGPAGDDGSDPTDEVDIVTLVTGDRVRVWTAADGDLSAALVADPARPGRSAMVSYRRDSVTVIPTDALSAVRSGALDPSLFDVTALAAGPAEGPGELGELRYLVASESSPLADGPGPGADAAGAVDLDTIEAVAPEEDLPGEATVVAEAPTLGVVGVEVDAEDAAGFWESLTAGESGEGGALRDGVGRVTLDRRSPWTLAESVAQIGVSAAYDRGFDGSGVTVAVLDSGIDDEHPDVAGQVVAERDFTGLGGTDDVLGHGTTVASIIAGTGEVSGGTYRGVAPGARLLDGRVGDEFGVTTSSVLAGMEWAAQQGADVANLSLGLGSSDGTDPVSQAVDVLTAEYGILFVAAAGNGGVAWPAAAPGTADAALTVGSVGRTDAVSEFSSAAPRLGDGAVKPEVTAPGEGVVAARAEGAYPHREGPVDGYVAVSGTSMAAPHAAGAAALLTHAYPERTPAQLKAALVSSAAPTPGTSVFSQGVGRVDVAAAIAAAEAGVGVDAGSLSFGHVDWPYAELPEQTRAVTYTNDSDEPVTVDVSVGDVTAFAPSGNPDTLDPAVVSARPASFELAPGATQEVTLALTPADVPPGTWGGVLTATTSAGPTLRTAFSVDMEPERHDVSVTVRGPDGAILSQADPDLWVTLVNLDTDEYLSNGPDVDLSALSLEPGLWSVTASFYDRGIERRSFHLASEPEAVVDGPRDIVLDLGAGEPVRVGVVDDEVAAVSQAVGFDQQSKDARAGMGLATDLAYDLDTFVAPSAQATESALVFEASTDLAEPGIAVSVDGAPGLESVTPSLVTRDRRLDGTRTAPVRPAADVGPGEVALLGVTEDGPLDDEVAAAAGAGAVAVLVYEATSSLLLWLDGAGDVPVMRLPDGRGQGEALAAAMAAGEVTLTMTGSYYPPAAYHLVTQSRGALPAGMDVAYERRELAAVRESVGAMNGPGSMTESLTSLDSIHAYSPGTRVEPGGRRVLYLTPGSWEATLRYGRYVSRDFPWDAQGVTSWTEPLADVAAGKEYQRTWLRQVMRPAVPAGDRVVASRSGDRVTASLPLWVDGEGRPSSGDTWAVTSAWELGADGEVVASGTDPAFIDAQVPEQAEDLTLDVTAEVSPDAEDWRLSTSTTTQWRFPSGTGTLPLLSVDYELQPSLRSDNTARGGWPTRIEVSGRMPADLDPVRVESATLEYSVDGGATWQDARFVQRVDDDTFAGWVRTPHQAGDVDLRVTLQGAAGIGVTQRVSAAYAVR